MSVDQQAAASEPACDHCGTRDETVRECHLAPIGNLVTVQACADCRRQFGTVEPVDAVGEVHGFTAPDGVCLDCREPIDGHGYSHQQEFPLAGNSAYIEGSLCEECALEQGRAFIDGGE